MKSFTLPIAILTFVLLSTGYAQKYFPSYESYRTKNVELAAKNYLHSLESTNEGVVTSALAQIGRMKLYFPARSFTDLEKKIAELSLNGETSNIRYRAFLVSNIFNNPGTFSIEASTTFEDSEALFSALSSRLNSSLLGSNNAR